MLAVPLKTKCGIADPAESSPIFQSHFGCHHSPFFCFLQDIVFGSAPHFPPAAVDFFDAAVSEAAGFDAAAFNDTAVVALVVANAVDFIDAAGNDAACNDVAGEDAVDFFDTAANDASFAVEDAVAFFITDIDLLDSFNAAFVAGFDAAAVGASCVFFATHWGHVVMSLPSVVPQGT